jgi:hypothetical protein
MFNEKGSFKKEKKRNQEVFLVNYSQNNPGIYPTDRRKINTRKITRPLFFHGSLSPYK